MGQTISRMFTEFRTTFGYVYPSDEILFKRIYGGWSKTMRRYGEEKMRKLKVGVIGCGQVAQIVWLPYVHELDEYDIIAFSDISNKLLDYYGNLYGVKKCYMDWHDLLRDEEVEAVIVLNSNHTEVCIEAAKAKKHILVEKPLCENIDQAKEIEKAVLENHVILMVGEMKRYDSGYRYARELIQNMKGLRMIRARDVCDGLAASQPEIYESRRRTDVKQCIKDEINQNFYSNLKKVTGNLSEDLYFRLLLAGVHDIDILRSAFGEPAGISYCDIWDSGNMLIAELDYGEQVKAILEVGYTNQKWFDEELTAYGLDQTITVKFPHPYIRNCPTLIKITENQDGRIEEREITVSFDEAFRNELLHFYECVVENKTPDTNIEEGKKDMQLLNDIFQCYARRIQC
ncbi:gfo/Idh/MocA family oxidoreductase [Faecalicatena contorta]|nr:gfo/Idh/MocA family oxidoreductase [Faecalicatena contorta]